VTITAWRLPVAVLAVLFSLVLVLGGLVLEGVIISAVAMLWLVSHAGVAESAGIRFLHRRAYIEFAKIVLLAVLLLTAVAAIAVGFALGWNRHPEGPVMFSALYGVAILLMRELERCSKTFENHMDGGDAEVYVSELLQTLPDDWRVEENWLRPDGRGNVDHIVVRPDGTWFAIETKSHRFRHAAAAQAVGGAVAVKVAHNVPWVVPVVCVVDETQPTSERAVGRSKVWVVDRSRLLELLKTVPLRQTPR
jgi:hypothetical protein